MNCPICKKQVEKNTKYFPFCCDRCKQIDLYQWLSEEYCISEPISITEENNNLYGEGNDIRRDD